ncbi:hypothetical protein TWF506_005848 [Arthrobotrys conoides]|uniref:BTB domain-containing protein n=1 Tax=Arthrobotrys conoides TaxID=74498 RepID=A0AAN8RW90_9PEZI
MQRTLLETRPNQNTYYPQYLTDLPQTMSTPSASSPSSSSESRPKKRARTSKAIDDGLMKLLENPQFADVKVLVGVNEKNYDLHRNIISLSSSFFEAACREGRPFIESVEKLIKLPDIEPKEFDVVIQWIYQGGYKLPDYAKCDEFCNVFKAVDFLGVDGLKSEMLDQLTKLFSKNSFREDEPVRFGENGAKFFDRITQYCSISDWLELRKMGDQIFNYWYDVDSKLVEMGREDLGNAIRIDLYQELFRNNVCGVCYSKLFENTEAKCRICTRDLETMTCRQKTGVPMGKHPNESQGSEAFED